MKRRIGRKPLPQLFHRIFHHVRRNVSGQNHEIAVGKNKKLAARRTDHTVKQFGENLNELGMAVFRLKLGNADIQNRIAERVSGNTV